MAVTMPAMAVAGPVTLMVPASGRCNMVMGSGTHAAAATTAPATACTTAPTTTPMHPSVGGQGVSSTPIVVYGFFFEGRVRSMWLAPFTVPLTLSGARRRGRDVRWRGCYHGHRRRKAQGSLGLDGLNQRQV